MNRQSSNSMQVVKREEKETRLTQFVLSEIAAGRVSLSGEWRVVALTFESPVVQALHRVICELGEASELSIRVVLTDRGRHDAGDLFVGAGSLALRTSQSSRLLDAHEQLVLGSRSSWTGDCMRRNPRERDAFETFGGDDEQLAEWARRSFDRLWSNSLPAKVQGRSKEAMMSPELDLVVGDVAKSDAIVGATSRH